MVVEGISFSQGVSGLRQTPAGGGPVGCHTSVGGVDAIYADSQPTGVRTPCQHGGHQAWDNQTTRQVGSLYIIITGIGKPTCFWIFTRSSLFLNNRRS